MKKIIRNFRHTRFLGLATIAIAALTIVLTTIAVREVSNFRSRAAAAVQIYATPASANLPPNSSFIIMINPSLNQIAFASVELTFDPNLVQLTGEIIPGNTLKTIISKTTMAQANTTGHITLTLGLDPADRSNPPTSTFELGHFTLTPRTNNYQTTGISFVPASVQVVDINANIISVNTLGSNLTLNQPQATPIPTPSPILVTPPPVTPTPSPTIRPTPTTTPRPSATPTAAPVISLPTIPTGLTATAGNGSVTLKWNANPLIDAVDYYQIYEADQYLNLYIPGNQTTFTTKADHAGTAFVSGRTYSFRISAHNRAGYGAWTYPVTVIPGSSIMPTPTSIPQTPVPTPVPTATPRPTVMPTPITTATPRPTITPAPTTGGGTINTCLIFSRCQQPTANLSQFPATSFSVNFGPNNTTTNFSTSEQPNTTLANGYQALCKLSVANIPLTWGQGLAFTYTSASVNPANSAWTTKFYDWYTNQSLSSFYSYKSGSQYSDGTLFVNNSTPNRVLAINNDWSCNASLPAPTTSPAPAPVTRTGLWGEYYNNKDFTAYSFGRADAPINFNWYYGAPSSAMSSDTFSVRWTGYFTAPVTGTYTFYTGGDDGTRLWVNNQQVVYYWSDHSFSYKSGTIDLVAGQKYYLKFEFYENGGRAQVQLQYAAPGISRQTIPAELLSY